MKTQQELNNDLFIAVKKKNPELVKLAIQNGANINDRNSNDKHIIHNVMISSIDVLKILIEHKVDINAKTSTIKETLLHMACSRNRPDIVKELLLYDHLDINIQNTNNITALFYASVAGDIAIVKQLLKNPKIAIDIKCYQENTAINGAIITGHITVAEALIRAGADCTLKNDCENNSFDLINRSKFSFEQKKDLVSLINHYSCNKNEIKTSKTKTTTQETYIQEEQNLNTEIKQEKIKLENKLNKVQQDKVKEINEESRDTLENITNNLKQEKEEVLAHKQIEKETPVDENQLQLKIREILIIVKQEEEINIQTKILKIQKKILQTEEKILIAQKSLYASNANEIKEIHQNTITKKQIKLQELQIKLDQIKIQPRNENSQLKEKIEEINNILNAKEIDKQIEEFVYVQDDINKNQVSIINQNQSAQAGLNNNPFQVELNDNLFANLLQIELYNNPSQENTQFDSEILGNFDVNLNA